MSESKPKPITIRVPVTLLIPELDNIKHVSLQFTRALGPLNQGVPPTNGGAGWDTQNVVQINPAGPGTISINDQNQAAQRFVFSTADGMSTPTSAGRILVEVQAFLDTANPVDGQNLLVTLYHDLGKAGSGPIPSNLWVLGAQGEFLLGGAILGAAGVSQTLPNSQGGSTISIPFRICLKGL